MTFTELAESIVSRCKGTKLESSDKRFFVVKAWATRKQVRWLSDLYLRETGETMRSSGSGELGDENVGYRVLRITPNGSAIVEKWERRIQ